MNIAIERAFADRSTKHPAAFAFAECGARGNFSVYHPIFDIFYKFEIVADFQRRAVYCLIHKIQIIRFIRAVNRNGCIMPIAVTIGESAYFLRTFSALQFVIDGGKANAELFRNRLFMQSRFQKRFQFPPPR